MMMDHDPVNIRHPQTSVMGDWGDWGDSSPLASYLSPIALEREQ